LRHDTQKWGNAQFKYLAKTVTVTLSHVRMREVDGDVWWCNISGGTDFCGAFIGGNRELPQEPGVMQCRLLGCAVEAWSEHGRARAW
jgi:acetoacetyl-CoA synthetase